MLAITANREVNLQWSTDDRDFARLFRLDQLLPGCGSMHLRIQDLYQLDNLIVRFEAYLGHEDSNFAAWRSRHQQAIVREVETITDKQHYVQWTGYRTLWVDNRWNEHYSRLVHLREKLLTDRLSAMGFGRGKIRDIFDQGTPFRHGDKFVRHGGKSRKLRNPSCDSVNVLLERYCEAKGQDGAALCRNFWATCQSLGPTNVNF